jgi:hypothetical protein
MAIVIQNLVGLDSTGSIPIVSVFTRQTITFDIDWGGATRTAVTVTASIGGTTITFTPVLTLTVGTVDSFFLDFSDVLKYVLGFPPMETTVTGTSLSFTYAIVITGSAVTDGETVVLMFSCPDIGDTTMMSNLYDKGATETIYHNGKISFYYPSSGVTSMTIGGISQNYTLVEGVNIVTLVATQNITGTMRIGFTLFELDLVYRLPLLGSGLSWMNKSGLWSYWSFRKTQEKYASEETNDIPLYYATHALTKANSRKIKRANSKSISFDTIAVDEVHYKQLCEMANSPVIMYMYRPYTIETITESVAACKQNMNFKVTLKATQNAVSY